MRESITAPDRLQMPLQIAKSKQKKWGFGCFMHAPSRLIFVQIPPEQATPQQNLSSKKRMNQRMAFKRRLGANLRETGHKFLTPGYLLFCRRLEAASAKSHANGNEGWVPSSETNRMVESHDGTRKVRPTRARTKITQRLREAGIVETRRGWVRWVADFGHLSAVDSSADKVPHVSNGKVYFRSKSRLEQEKRDRVARRALLAAASAAAGPGPKKNKKQIFQNANTSAARAASRHAKRDSSGKFIAAKPVLAVEAASAAVGILKKTPENQAAKTIAELFLAFGAAHPQSQNPRIAVEDARQAVLCERRKPPPQAQAPSTLTAFIVQRVNADYGLNLNIFKLRRAGILDENLIDAAHFTYKKHLETPFDSLEGAIVHAALQRKRGLW